ncbi:hypothetical protein FQA47_001815 [Oryzias melastigma]|uniref:Uncharacterized protein n=1 Tax=Oryzias melastigma TaxID=30732 RepID=A0A834FMJ7_ORYME|nr:hypothetical protein FQA47_001815 [Oryzias melastigma]
MENGSAAKGNGCEGEKMEPLATAADSLLTDPSQQMFELSPQVFYPRAGPGSSPFPDLAPFTHTFTLQGLHRLPSTGLLPSIVFTAEAAVTEAAANISPRFIVLRLWLPHTVN